MFQLIDVLSVVISVTGLLQAAFLFMVLRNEGVSAWQTNRWMGVFLLSLSLSFLRDIILLIGGTAVALMVDCLYLLSAPNLTGSLPIRRHFLIRSKSTFNLAFKRVTGMTPSHYRFQAAAEPDSMDLGAHISLTPIRPTGS